MLKLKALFSNSTILVAATFAAFQVTSVQAESLDKVLSSSENKVTAAAKSQQKVNTLADQAQTLFDEYKVTEKLVEDLKVYNQKLEVQVKNQAKRLDEIKSSIAQVQVMQRQMLPLISDMVKQLEQFIALDMPFHIEEREERIAFLKKSIDRSELSTAEKFRQLLEAWKIENEYGRKIETYPASINLAEGEREVSILRVGRIAMVYQSLDGSETGGWYKQTKQWQVLDAAQYQSAIKQAIKIANKQANIDVITLPVMTAEAL